ncbi:hypothetical protein [Geminocystis sp. NIES-3709]|uniref:hypothetical protein n=1 Tax=Geminocystis sp. NIES-3709 TaxID=1617448 RepID=UPI0005FCC084|nr:hypothetical protein [Geminocystis sp. NIES-3709]BAQ65112.1 hypothetical protein GM3709_1877 [Geminocystis sp. NIES-3709]
MFKNVIVKSPSPNADSIKPTVSDCQQILGQLNTGNFYRRVSPQKNIQNIISQSQQQFLNQNRHLTPYNCHSISKIVQKNYSNLGYRQVSGYLIKSNIEINFKENNSTSISNPPYFVYHPDTRNVGTWLHHHSVVCDNQSNYIECLPEDWYPINEFLFIPHQSGIKGYFLEAE